MKKGKFSERMQQRILKLAEDGKTIEEIAMYVGISERTLYNWSGRFPDFKAALKDSKSIADELVEASLFRRAVGYEHKAKKIFFDAKSLSVVEHDYTEKFAPDTSAGIFWLKNRDPERWKDKTEVKHEGSIDQLSDDELDAKIEEKVTKSKAK